MKTMSVVSVYVGRDPPPIAGVLQQIKDALYTIPPRAVV